MKRHGHLFDRIIAFDNLLQAAQRAQRGKRHRHSVAAFLFHLEPEVFFLQEALRSGTYRMQPYHTFTIYEPKRRQICAAAFRDRVVHHAICAALDPLFEASLITHTYACRRGKGTLAATKRAQAYARRWSYVLTCDIQHYFATVDHTVLKTLLRRNLKDSALLTLLDHIIDHPIPNSPPGTGLPIGNLTSQYFANLYLGELDHLLSDRLGCQGYVRYMDDFLVFADDKRRLWALLERIRLFLSTTLRLTLKEAAVPVMPVTQGIAFLGLRVFPGALRLQRKSWTRFRRRVRWMETQYLCGMISEKTLAQSVHSMLGHVQHADVLPARRAFFAASQSLG